MYICVFKNKLCVKIKTNKRPDSCILLASLGEEHIMMVDVDDSLKSGTLVPQL